MFTCNRSLPINSLKDLLSQEDGAGVLVEIIDALEDGHFDHYIIDSLVPKGLGWQADEETLIVTLHVLDGQKDLTDTTRKAMEDARAGLEATKQFLDS
ncbi:hypothetical protein N7527_008741 [Penicillium freii]|uniref:Uncharacterized protein n=1 Tax=Penicillium freii TaxID=48697 RepID=A0A117NL09_PENFR|nr:hypothetical protein N7527_008741 [Penicillium freii]KUM56948.1 hypothetical protein ACN42_g10256 [Penicillium freii]